MRRILKPSWLPPERRAPCWRARRRARRGRRFRSPGRRPAPSLPVLGSDRPRSLPSLFARANSAGSRPPQAHSLWRLRLPASTATIRTGRACGRGGRASRCRRRDHRKTARSRHRDVQPTRSSRDALRAGTRRVRRHSRLRCGRFLQRRLARRPARTSRCRGRRAPVAAAPSCRRRPGQRGTARPCASGSSRPANAYGRVNAEICAAVGCEYLPSSVGAPLLKRGSAKLTPAGPAAITTNCFPPRV